MLELRSLSKTFSDIRAFNGISLTTIWPDIGRYPASAIARF